MLLWPIKWLLRRPVQSVRRGMLSWQPLASFMLPGDMVWTDVTMAGSLTAVHDTLLQNPECSVGEVCSASGPCTATETRPASRNQLWNSELTVSKVNSLIRSSILCHEIKCYLHMVGCICLYFGLGSDRQWVKRQTIHCQKQAWTVRGYDLISSLPLLPHPLIFCFFALLYTFPHLNQTNTLKCLQPVSSSVHCSGGMFFLWASHVTCQSSLTDCSFELTSLSHV